MDDGSKQFMNKAINIKLDDSNYLHWRQQVGFTITSHKLDSFLDGSARIDEWMTSEDGLKIRNPTFDSYKQQDGALASWLLSSISPGLLSNLVRCTMSHEIWTTIQQLFSVSSTTRIMRLLCSLQLQRKCDVSMHEYLGRIQQICDSLCCSDHPLIHTTDLQISTILTSFGAEYEHVVAVITASRQPYDLAGVTSVLLDAESRQQANMSHLPSPVSFHMSANASSTSNGNAGNYTSSHNTSAFSGHPGSSSQMRYSSSTSHPSDNTPSYGRGRGRQSASSHSGRLQCQLCGKFGHLVARCWHCFDHGYSGLQLPPQAIPPYTAHNPEFNSPLSTFSHQFDDYSHPYFPNRSSFGPQHPSDCHQGLLLTPSPSTILPGSHPQAHMAWFLDSGASHHMTNSTPSLPNSTTYSGTGRQTHQVLLEGTENEGLYQLHLPLSSTGSHTSHYRKMFPMGRLFNL